MKVAWYLCISAGVTGGKPGNPAMPPVGPAATGIPGPMTPADTATKPGPVGPAAAADMAAGTPPDGGPLPAAGYPADGGPDLGAGCGVKGMGLGDCMPVTWGCMGGLMPVICG